MKNVHILLISVLISFTSISAQTNDSSNFDLPSYISPVAAKSDSGSWQVWSRGNSVLVDKENRLFATSAHIVGLADAVMIKVFNEWYPAELRDKWINCEADIAIIRLTTDAIILPEPVCLGEVPLSGSSITLNGYKIKKNESGPLDFIPYALKGMVSDPHAGWDVSQDHKEEVAELVTRQDQEEIIPKEKLYLLYKNYILFLFTMNQELYEIPDGLSGSLVSLTETGCLEGTLIGASRFAGLAAPVNEIEILLKKVQAELEAPESPKE
ncbi:hypothetical protein MYX07_06975 [Patescibacteria group bacterium AH-259-L07]|nr:hypothetical protein [Patescibacteria group bacterium AH-259-L07]